MSTIVKICGITRFEDAKAAVDAGADALGFNFSELSARQISPTEAQTIARQLPADVWICGVFVNHDRAVVEQIARSVGLDTLQFHGDEPAEFLENWDSWRIIKALRIGSKADLAVVEQFSQSCDHLLLDARVAGSYGGSGKAIEDELLDELANSGALQNALLAGGLTPETVGEKVRRYKPFGVDVASGVESSPGVKNSEQIQQFIQSVRETD